MRWFPGGTVVAAAVLSMLAPLPAFAQYVGTTAPLFPTLIVPMFPNGNTVPFSGQSARHRAARPAPTHGVASPASLLANGPAQIDANALDLATHFPPELRAKMKVNYVQSFGTFQQFERKLNLTSNDVTNGIAAYIAGNYMILHGVELGDPAFLKLTAQLRARLLESPGFQKIPPLQKRKLYEQTAMVGMFMAVAQLSRKTAPENTDTIRILQDSARANLALVLGDRAATLSIDGQGMHL